MTRRPRKAEALDEGAFVEELASAIAAALARCAERVGGRTLDYLAIDVHPWSGFLNLSLRLEDDEEPRRDGNQVWVGDWELSHVAVAHERGSGGWPEARRLAERMKAEVEGRPDEETATTARFYRLCGEAAGDARVWAALGDHSRTPSFRIAVPDVDCRAAPIEVGRPRRPSKRPRSAPAETTTAGPEGPAASNTRGREAREAIV